MQPFTKRKKAMKLEIEFGEETRFIVPDQQLLPANTKSLAGTMHGLWTKTGFWKAPLRTTHKRPDLLHSVTGSLRSIG